MQLKNDNYAEQKQYWYLFYWKIAHNTFLFLVTHDVSADYLLCNNFTGMIGKIDTCIDRREKCDSLNEKDIYNDNNRLNMSFICVKISVQEESNIFSVHFQARKKENFLTLSISSFLFLNSCRLLSLFDRKAEDTGISMWYFLCSSQSIILIQWNEKSILEILRNRNRSRKKSFVMWLYQPQVLTNLC